MAEPRAFSNFKRIIAGSASTEKDIEAMKDEIAEYVPALLADHSLKRYQHPDRQ